MWFTFSSVRSASSLMRLRTACSACRTSRSSTYLPTMLQKNTGRVRPQCYKKTLAEGRASLVEVKVLREAEQVVHVRLLNLLRFSCRQRPRGFVRPLHAHASAFARASAYGCMLARTFSFFLSPPPPPPTCCAMSSLLTPMLLPPSCLPHFVTISRCTSCDLHAVPNLPDLPDGCPQLGGVLLEPLHLHLPHNLFIAVRTKRNAVHNQRLHHRSLL